MATATFTVPWVSADRFSISFKTDIDAEYTAHEQRNALWTNPQYKWSVNIPRSQANWSALQAFFIDRKGRFNAFNFIFDSSKGGDGVTYLVRFDTPNDELVFTATDAHWVVPLVQVVS